MTISTSHAQVFNTSKAIDSNWFDSDIVPSPKGSQGATIVKHTLMIKVDTTSVVNIQYKMNTETSVMDLNGGTALTGGAVYVFDILVPSNIDGYNIQHKTATQNITALIAEIEPALIG